MEQGSLLIQLRFERWFGNCFCSKLAACSYNACLVPLLGLDGFLQVKFLKGFNNDANVVLDLHFQQSTK